MTATTTTARPQTAARAQTADRLLRDAAFVLRLTQRVKADILGATGSGPAGTPRPVRRQGRPQFGTAV